MTSSDTSANTRSVQKIAILGGGPAGLAAAYFLTDPPDWRERYEITVYQEGWALGGKCASGRNPEKNWRSEEHGIHLLTGYYTNSFQMIRGAYAELDRPPDQPFATWESAMTGCDTSVYMELDRGKWREWAVTLPANGETPGDGWEPTAWDLITRLLDWIKKLFSGWRGGAEPTSLKGKVLGGLFHLAAWTGGVTLGAAAHRHARSLGSDATGHDPEDHRRLLEKLDRYHGWLERWADWLLHEMPTPIRRLFLLLNLFGAVIRGAIADDILNKGWDSINDQDLRDWLRSHGASQDAVTSAPIEVMYKAFFAFPDGANTEGSLAAGVCLKAMLMIFLGYRGHLFYKQEAGVGETLIAPVYQTLVKRGVRFEFFHEVEALGLSEDGGAIETIRVGRQARLKDGAYRPLVTSPKGVVCWPTHPLYDQIVDGDALAKLEPSLQSAWPAKTGETLHLRRGSDFDRVVLAIPLGALGKICGQLRERGGAWERRRKAWEDMLTRIPSVASVGIQLWMRPTLEEMGWRHGPNPAVGYVDPNSSWVDMTQVLAWEEWPSGETPGNLAYFCGVRKAGQDGPDQERAHAQVGDTAVEWFAKLTGNLWPDATTGDGEALDWSQVMADESLEGPQRLQDQFWAADVSPSARYVLSTPGSIGFRLPVYGSGCDNLLLAGDWVRTSVNGGAFEAAVMSGVAVQRVLDRDPRPIPNWPDWSLPAEEG